MNVYTAAVYTNHYRPSQDRWSWFEPYEQAAVRTAEKNILESYHYIRTPKFTREMHADNAKVFLDSGAFSAWTLKADLPIYDYCDYIKNHWDLIKEEDGVKLFSVMDGIGDADATWRNQMEMEDRGCRPLPCFHAGEPEAALEYYVARYPYITLGGMVGASVTQLARWLDRVWDRYLTDGSGRPKLKVHGFGITSEDLMKRYPWHSVDSSTWLQSATFGKIHVPVIGLVDISSKSPLRHDRGFHFINVSEMEREAIEAQIRADGFDPQRLADVYYSRVAYNLWGFARLQDEINGLNIKEFHPPVQELF